MDGIITLPVETLAIIFTGRRARKTQRIEADYFELGPAGRAREDLAPIHVELRDRDRMAAQGARRPGPFR